MKIKAISGGAFKIPALLSASSCLYSEAKYRPDIIAGVSSGAIVALIEAVGAWREADELVLDEEIRLRYKVFDKQPYKLNGKPTLGAALRLLRGHDHVSSMENLRKTLKQIITPEYFRNYKINLVAPEVVVLAVNMTTGSRRGFWLKHMNYDKAIEAVMASCAFPGFAAPVFIDGEYYHDGGIRNHCPGPWLLKYLEEGTGFELRLKERMELVSIYSRPHNFEDKTEEWKKNFFKTILRAFEIMEFENSKKDEMLEEHMLRDYNGKYSAICIEGFLPTPFEDDPKLLLKGYHLGIKAYNQYYRGKTKPSVI